MSENKSLDPALYPMLFFYAMSIYPKFEEMGYEAAKLSADSAGDFSLIEPLLMRDKYFEFASKEIPPFGVCSAPFCVALMGSLIIWASHKGLGDEIYVPDSPILKPCEDAWQLWKRETQQ